MYIFVSAVVVLVVKFVGSKWVKLRDPPITVGFPEYMIVVDNPIGVKEALKVLVSITDWDTEKEADSGTVELLLSNRFDFKSSCDSFVIEPFLRLYCKSQTASMVDTEV